MATLARARKLHRQGRLAEAEGTYLHHLDGNPADAEALHHLGLLHAETGRQQTALQLLRVAIELAGPQPHLCRNLGILLERLGERSAAVACYRQALAASPADSELWVRIASLHTADRQFAEASEAWSHAVSHCARGHEADYRFCWGNVLAEHGARSEAAAQFASVLRLDPKRNDARFHLGVVLMQCDQTAQAAEIFRQVLLQDPTHARAANNLGILQQIEKQFSEAIASYRQAVATDRNYTEPIYNLGTAWGENGRPREAICVLRKSISLRPDDPSAWNHLGNARLACNEVAEARRCYQRTLDLDPGETAAAWNLGITALLEGRFLEGWAGFERRFEVRGAAPRRALPAPLWRGEPLAGRTLLLHAEQGLGDTIQFIRYAPLFAAGGARVVVECQAPLIRLFESITGIASCQAPPAALHAQADFQIPLLSAPALAATEPATIPSPGGYLSASSASIAKWSAWLGARSAAQRRVGIAWAGNPLHKNDRNRSLPATLLAVLSDVAGVEWISLQKGTTLPPAPLMRDAGPLLEDFADTAALMTQLDLIISVDTAVAHLAGALGRPVWILLPFAPDWRWMLDRADSPWYTSARLFRQPRLGDWPSVLSQVREALSLPTA